MQSILVLNPKGGAGKSTLATNLAGFFACWGIRVTIADYDSQMTSLDWLAARPPSCPRIEGVVAQRPGLPAGSSSDYMILDVPSGGDNEALLPLIQRADRILVPVVPSPHDMRAAARFLDWLATDECFKDVCSSIAIVANRVRKQTRSFRLLQEFLLSTPVPCIGVLRDTQNYVHAAQHGLSLFELPKSRVRHDLQQWQRIVNWLCADPYMVADIPVKPDESVYEAIYGVTVDIQ